MNTKGNAFIPSLLLLSTHSTHCVDVNATVLCSVCVVLAYYNEKSYSE